MAAGVTTVVGNKVGWESATQGLLTDIDTVQRNMLGMISRDDAGNEYIYLKGVASCVAASCVNSHEDFVPILLAAGLGTSGPVAVSLGAVLAVNFGWFVIR